MPKLAVIGHPGRALALAGDAERGAGGARARGRVALRGDRRRPRRLRDDGAGAGRRSATPAPTSPSRTRKRRWRWPTRRARPRGRSAPPTRSSSTASGSRPTTPTPTACWRRCRSRRGGRSALVLGAGGAARAALWALRWEGARVDVWNRTAERAEQSAPSWGGRRSLAPRQAELRPDRQHQRRSGWAARTRSRTCRSSREGFGESQTVVDMVYGDQPSQLLEAAAAAGRDSRRRPRDPRPAGRPLAGDLDRPRHPTSR